MPREEPDATSTPTTVPHIAGRPPIRGNVSVQSPILESIKPPYETRSFTRTNESYKTDVRKSPSQSPRKSPRSFSNEANRRSGSYDSDSDPDQYSDGEGLSSDGDHHEPELAREESQNKNQIPKYLGSIFVVFVAAMAYLYLLGEASPELNHDDFEIAQQEFRNQDVDFWRSIRVSIKEIPVLEQPRTIMFLYNNKAERTLEKILQRISRLASPFLSSDSQYEVKAVEIAGATLNTSEIVNDYGKIISRYRGDLEKRGLMIVRNLEKVPGASAQAFHSFCDDYNPVVKKALILFTLKVEKLPEGYPMKFVENFLLKLWNDIGKDDKFYPLFTRISSTILPVRPE